ncbi:MAG TPA: L-aspartate oxidase [Vicinamibacterales bacterium]|nr:L-aspartate oxidase [Vicinamibacterales bacterium]
MPRRTDFLIIGSGIAGLRAAADLAQAGEVLILTKADPTESNTGYAQGGIAAAVDAADTPRDHAIDTINAGDGLCVQKAVNVLVEDGVRYVHELIEWGARFDRDRTGALSLGREGAHGRRRVLHATDATGREIGRTLWERVADQSRVRVERNARAHELIVEGNRCIGARYQNESGVHEVHAGAVLLATGGAGQVFRETTNPSIATGDGVMLGWFAGARITDVEFVQFHPTALDVPGAPRFLLSEALRGEGAQLLNAAGERFMTRYEPAGELASRDLVSRAIVREQGRTGQPVYLSMAHLDPEWTRARFPTIARACRSLGLDIGIDRIPVGPAAHYLMGGVETDLWGRTTVPGLYAAGEVACTGVHGANRLASNSLLEGLVFGARVAQAMLLPGEEAAPFSTLAIEDEGLHGRPDYALRAPSRSRASASREGGQGYGGQPPLEKDVRGLMWNSVGLWREEALLRTAIDALDEWYEALGDDRSALAALVTAGRLMARAALRREETRGSHARADFPSRDDVKFGLHFGDKREI